MKNTKDGIIIIYEKFFAQFKFKILVCLAVYAVCCGLIYAYGKHIPFWFYFLFLPVSFFIFVVQRNKVTIDGDYITDTIGKIFKIQEIFSVDIEYQEIISVRFLKEEPHLLLKEGKYLEDYLEFSAFLAENFNKEDWEYLVKLFSPYKENYLKYYPDYAEHCKAFLNSRTPSEKQALKKFGKIP